MNKSQAGKFLSSALRELSQEAHDTNGSETKTRAECLAKLVWEAALGGDRRQWDAKLESFVQKYMAPQTWAIHLLFDRLEGKVAMSDEGGASELTLAQRVDKIDQDRINDLA